MEERRRTPRQAAHAAVVLDDGAIFHAGTARDVSDGGVFFETTATLVPGTTVHLSPLERPGMEVRARVVHADGRGVGLELLDAPERCQTLVAHLLGTRPHAPRPLPRRTTIPPGQSGTS